MRGLFVGRFQPLHNGHMFIIEKALEDVDELIVGIGSAESSHTMADPFTAGERCEMVLRATSSLGRRVVPIPVRDVNRYSIWVQHVNSIVPPYDFVYSNNPLTRELFSDAGTEVRGTAIVDRTALSGDNIRRVMREGGDWKALVPAPVADFIEEAGLLRRVVGR